MGMEVASQDQKGNLNSIDNFYFREFHEIKNLKEMLYLKV